jgi:hypothetical protein
MAPVSSSGFAELAYVVTHWQYWVIAAVLVAAAFYVRVARSR